MGKSTTYVPIKGIRMALTKDRLKHSITIATRMRAMAEDESEDAFVLGLQTLEGSVLSWGGAGLL